MTDKNEDIGCPVRGVKGLCCWLGAGGPMCIFHLTMKPHHDEPDRTPCPGPDCERRKGERRLRTCHHYIFIDEHCQDCDAPFEPRRVIADRRKPQAEPLKKDWLENELHKAQAEVAAWPNWKKDAARLELQANSSPETKPESVGLAGCEDCGRPYGDLGFPDLCIPDAAWQAISPSGEHGGLLCPSCICARLTKAGLSEVKGYWGSGPFCEKPSSEIEHALAALRFWRDKYSEAIAKITLLQKAQAEPKPDSAGLVEGVLHIANSVGGERAEYLRHVAAEITRLGASNYLLDDIVSEYEEADEDQVEKIERLQKAVEHLQTCHGYIQTNDAFRDSRCPDSAHKV